MTKTWFRGLAMAMVALVGLMMIPGCGSKGRRIKPDITFSYNVVATPADWPNEKKDWPKDPRMAAFQQAVYEEHGAPDFFRILYDRSGRVVTQRELKEKAWVQRNNKQARLDTEFEWIYLDKKLTYRFEARGPIKADLPDNIRILCEYGDPMEMKTTIDINKRNLVIYQYYDRGKIFYFHEGKLDKEEDITAMPGMFMRK
jgi:hypothetical protein